MKKIEYDGSIASDISIIKSHSKLSRNIRGSSVISCILFSLVYPFTYGITLPAVVITGIIMSLLGVLVSLGIDIHHLVKKYKARGRINELLNSLSFRSGKNLEDMKVLDVTMNIKYFDHLKKGHGNYIVVKDNERKLFIRENEIIDSEYLEYVQYLMDLNDIVDRELALQELATSDEVVILRK